MAQPVTVARTGDQRIDGLLGRFGWQDADLLYSNPQTRSDYGFAYVSDANGNMVSAQREHFAPVTPDQFRVVQSALDIDHRGAVPARAGFAVEGFTQLEFDYAGPNGRGTLRFANSSDAETAYAALPGGENGGDVWFGDSGRFPEVGNYDLATILHEIGHTLGLKHPHLPRPFGAAPQDVDSLEFSVMSYRSFVGARPNAGYHAEDGGFPQSFMMLDIAALQHLYGANFSVNSGNTVYSWSPDGGATSVNGEVALPASFDRIFATIWDGGGIDTYDLSAYRGALAIDLRPGHASTFAPEQLAGLGGGPNGGHARGNIFNALQHDHDPRSLIENAIGGSGDDRTLGNDANNLLSGGDGADTLRGFLGADRLCGGRGPDTFLFRSASDSAPGDADTIVAGRGARAFEGAGAAGGDVIDLSAIDANTIRPGDQAFRLGAVTGRGHLWLEEHGTLTVVCGNTDRDAVAEFQLAIGDWGVRATSYTADDFVL